MHNGPLDVWLAHCMARSGTPTPDELRQWQFARIRELLARATADSPFYARHLAGVRPEAVRSPEDLGRLPRTTAEDLRARSEAMLCVSQSDVARVVTLRSSGTSGPPKRLFFSAGDLERTTRFFEYGMQSLTAPGDTVLVMLPGTRPGGVARLLAEALLRTGRRAVVPDEGAGAAQAAELALASDARAMVGAPMHCNALAAAWTERSLPRGHIRSALVCWDAIPRAVAERLHHALGCTVFRHWGMTETGLGGAVECAEGSGLHLREADLYVEIADPATGHPVPGGHWGEIVVTTFTRRAMPLIRYRTGDRGRLLPEGCACGSPLRRLDTIPGRLGEGVVLPTGDALRIMDIHEAVLAVDGVADCRAQLEGGVPPRLEVAVATPVADQWEVRRGATMAVAELPVVRRAMEAGLLKFSVDIAADADPPLTFEKRGLDIRLPEPAAP